ncbi:hypothetical protein N7476_005111 [Penicillium atrosanguineum]|uniref:Protein kinase domain-containing protein n=1 Tax=Penicillium atrosanguineum TaxID=1132637 RepID=A0A9W9Q0W5_9EURO|nr:hypothetical protein N7476_005111 [Penicillium atrosanguineum]
MKRQDAREYDIRQYPNEESSHPIVKAMNACCDCELNDMRHVLMPLQIFNHIKNKLFYTVSEETSMNLSGFLQGVQKWEDFLCHDEIWSIVKQVLSGINFLVSQGLQHDQISLQNILLTWGGVVKIAAIDRITEERPEDWPRTIKAVKHLAESLIQASKKPCIRCIDNPCGSNARKQCCDGASMLADAHSLDKLLDNTRALTETATSFQDIIQQTLSEAQLLPFIHQAQGSRLALITKFAWKHIHSDATPGGRPSQRASLAKGVSAQ